jgi:hypothetical protein
MPGATFCPNDFSAGIKCRLCLAGGGFIPKSGIFQCLEPGLYLFSLTVCTYDGKKCLLIIRKNEKVACYCWSFVVEMVYDYIIIKKIKQLFLCQPIC